MNTKLFLPILALMVIATIGKVVWKSRRAEPLELYRARSGNLWGYIDKTGKMVIPCQFYAAGNFSEGLAPVRKAGTYGYIDMTGQFVIEPRFDMALGFDNGWAKVFVDGEPFYIDKTGAALQNFPFEEVKPFEENQYAIVITKTKKHGVIDRKGRLVVDTAFKHIDPFRDGVAMVEGLNHQPERWRDTNKCPVFENGVITPSGKWVVKYGTYESIGSYCGGFASVSFNELTLREGDDRVGVIDTKGKLRFTIPSNEWYFSGQEEGFHEGFAIVSVRNPALDEVKDDYIDTHYDWGLVNADGELLFSSSEWTGLSTVSNHVAFAQDKNKQWFLIDTKGQKILNQALDIILYDNFGETKDELFKNGVAIIKQYNGWGAIDTKGRYVVKPIEFERLEDQTPRRVGDFIVFSQDSSIDNNTKTIDLYGFWNIFTNTLLEPQFLDIDLKGFEQGIIGVVDMDNKFGYINTKGEFLWKGEQHSNGDDLLNIDYMNRGYFFAAYPPEFIPPFLFRGYWKSNNFPIKISSTIKSHSDSLQIIIDTEQPMLWDERYQGFKLTLANASPDTFFFRAQDSRLYMNLEALDKKGEWKDIEFLRGSWCGNSYHLLSLAPNFQWEFAIPQYQGEFKTKIRAKLQYQKSDKWSDKEVYTLYSNEIDGSVNPGQFWNVKEVYPSGLMDRYYN